MNVYLLSVFELRLPSVAFRVWSQNFLTVGEAKDSAAAYLRKRGEQPGLWCHSSDQMLTVISPTVALLLRIEPVAL